MQTLADTVLDLSKLVVPPSQTSTEFTELMKRIREVLKTEQAESSHIFKLLMGLSKINNHSCDDILREIFLDNKMSRSYDSIVVQLNFFTGLLDSSGPNAPKDIMIIKRLIKELESLQVSQLVR